MRKIIEVDTQTDKYPILTLASGPTKDTVAVRVGKVEVVVDTEELVDALVMFEVRGE